MPKNKPTNSSIYAPSDIRDRFMELARSYGMSSPEFLTFLLDSLPQGIEGKTPVEMWGRFMNRIMPYVSDLASALLDRGFALNTNFSAQDGILEIKQFDMESTYADEG